MALTTTYSATPLIYQLSKEYFKSDLSYEASYEEMSSFAKQLISELKGSSEYQFEITEIKNFKTDTLNSKFIESLIDVQSKKGYDLFDLVTGLKSFVNVLKNEINNVRPTYADFKGSEGDDLVPLAAYDFVGHNKELKSTLVDYSNYTK